MSGRFPPGRLFRLRTLAAKHLPPHPAIKPVADAPTELFPFLRTVLDEAVFFADQTVPGTFKEHADKTSAPATAKIKLLSCHIRSQDLPFPDAKAEAWFARRSFHDNDKAPGTADWGEFDHGLRADHSVHEMEYTPGVFDARKVADWEDPIAAGSGKVEGGYSDVTMSVYEICHKLPVNNRVFCSLVITAKTAPDAFVVVQIPVDLSDFSDADVLYSNGRNKRDADTPLKRKKCIVGQYTSVERVKIADDGRICWLMATASDAKGWLPMSVQKLGTSSAVIKDVGLFMKWVDEKRGAGAVNGTGTATEAGTEAA